MNSSCSVAIMSARSTRDSAQNSISASVSAGSSIERRLPHNPSPSGVYPVAGSHSSRTANRKISRIAIMKLGTDRMPKVTPVETRSTSRPAR